MQRHRALFRDSYSLQFLNKQLPGVPLPRDVQQLKPFQLQGGFAPWPPTRGSAPGPRWRLCPQTPVIGSRSAFAMGLSPPKLKILATSLLGHDGAGARRKSRTSSHIVTAFRCDSEQLVVTWHICLLTSYVVFNFGSNSWCYFDSSLRRATCWMAYVLAYIYTQLLLIASRGLVLGTFGEFNLVML